MLIGAILFSAVLFQEPQTSAAPPPATAATATAEAQTPTEGPDRVVCRSQSVVGSNRRQRICMTARERDRQRDESREYRERMDRGYNPAADQPSVPHRGS